MADFLDMALRPNGVVVQAEHLCMSIRGVHAAGSSTVTSRLLDALRDDPRSRQE